MEWFEIRYASAEDIGRALGDLFESNKYLQHGVHAVGIDRQGNRLLVAATNGGLQLIHRLLVPPCCDPTPDGRTIQVIPLVHTLAVDMAKAWNRPDPSSDPRVIADPATNSLLVVSRKGTIDRVSDCLTAVDRLVGFFLLTR